MRKSVIALGLLGVLGAGPALAASPFEGAYVGGNIGYQNWPNRVSPNSGASGDEASTGASIGLDGGYGWRTGASYLGAELAGDLATTAGSLNGPLGQASVESHKQASVAVVPGLVVGNDAALVYGKAGWAIADGELSAAGSPSTTKTLNGPLLGGGVAIPVAQNVDARLDFAHTWYGKVSTPAGLMTPSEDQVKLGLDFHF